MAAKDSQSQQVYALAVITGTPDEKLKQFDAIGGTASAGIYGNWSNVVQIKAGCWMADSLQVHPVALMNGCHLMNVKGRLFVEPKWEFVNALLRARLPGFKFRVIEETTKACEIAFSVPGEEHIVRYTWEDATTQGHTSGANADTWKKNPREMLWKQCFKRGGDRIGAHVLSGLPAPNEFVEVVAEAVAGDVAAELSEAVGKSVAEIVLPDKPAVTAPPAAEKSGAEILDDKVPEPTPEPEPAHAVDEHYRLEMALREKFKGVVLNDSGLIDKACVVLEIMTKVKPARPKKFTDLPRQNVVAMLDYLHNLDQQRAGEQAAKAVATESTAALAQDDTPPPAEPLSPPQETRRGDCSWNDVLAAAAAFSRVVGTDLLGPGYNKATKQPVPEKQFLICKQVFENLGLDRPTLLWEAGQLCVSPAVLEQIVTEAARIVREKQKPAFAKEGA